VYGEEGAMEPLPLEDKVGSIILTLRGQRVIIDADLARLYGVSTKVLNQAVRRNRDRFPFDFAFILNEEEKKELVTNCDQFKNLRHSYNLPHAFTEHGAIMAASVLNSEQAIATSVIVVRAFVKMREALAQGATIGLKLGELEKRIDGHDEDIDAIFEAIRRLIGEPTRKKQIGFGRKEDEQ
jgi:hypothetical protein